MTVEPEAAAANGNGLHTNGIGPTVELAEVFGHSNGHEPVPVNGNTNGHYDEAEEPPQPLFSWAESMAEEPVKPKRGNGKLSPQACPCSNGRLALRRGLRRRRLARDVNVETQEGGGHRWRPPPAVHVCCLFAFPGY